MKHNILSGRRIYPNRLIIITFGCILLAIIFSYVVCGELSPLFRRPTRAPQQFPANDIIFNAGGELGFINSDGSNLTKIPFNPTTVSFASVWDQPLISGDNKTLIFSYRNEVDVKSVFIAQTGKFAVECTQWGFVRFVQFASDQEHILVESYLSDQGLAKYSLEDCGTDHVPIKTYIGVFGVLSPDEQFSAEVKFTSDSSQASMIVVRQVSNGNEKTVGPGDFPSWSRDSQWLAYTGADGIYVVNVSDSAEPRRVVALSNPDGINQLYQLDRAILFYPPMAYWSPDGQWIVYHVYHKSLGEGTSGNDPFYAIYKANVATGEQTKIVEGGRSPYWRWPAEEP